MVAVTYTDITAPAPRATSAPRRSQRRRAAHPDPVVEMTTRLLSGPLHQVYAFMWRVGLLVVDE